MSDKQTAKPRKVETIDEIKLRHLFRYFQESTGCADDSPIFLQMQRDMRFSLRMSRGKEAAKLKRANKIPPLFEQGK